jgi:hypothetical protein
VAGDDQSRDSGDRDRVNESDIADDTRRQSAESFANSHKNLRIPHKGYKVHVAVSPEERGKLMSKFAKLVKSAKIAGGFASW